MNYAQAIYQRSLQLPDTATFLRAISDGWGDDFPDDIDDADLGVDSLRDPL
ncbi:hypothetical protein [uncultured Sphaerotilus sp.]|uniref:hypothetical protein n=1 Tax=uncultured Sphaerotilus sp. TaxID=474984 RepID=UPI0030CA1A1F